MTNTPALQRLETAGGSIAYQVEGEGPLVVCVPGMADLRSSYRHLTPQLVAAGYRVATVDLRGHGDSDTTFESYDDEANAADVAALIDRLGGPALIVGNSMGAAIGALVAAQRPESVSALALLGPFVRDGKVSAATKAVMRFFTRPSFVAATWKSYYPKLNAGAKPSDFATYAAAVINGIRRPGHARAISQTMLTSHAPAEAALPRVKTPTLVVMGDLDPDFASPHEEATWVADALRGDVAMIPDAGHYPHSQRPDLVGPLLVEFANRVTDHA
ncbi:alpha/beta fold hydrolase [Ruicaihuangia caeni]|uniref:Alpha/beta hydrolase n=1 Tax=Ruicaihuangia caeni TaxID=3042517 RepID=A0AAW6T716_9MICO|nr:alpha/beta hydrolase [Klugiella sp. YN-L-19]MDI2099592.1 alpha/beta hydrolase [Klugiella sp. YN-L-19]